MEDIELIKGKKNRVVEAVNEILFDFIIFGVGSAIVWTVVLMILGRRDPHLGGIAFGAWSFCVATTVHCLQTDAAAIMIGMICLMFAGMTYGIMYFFYWVLFL